MGGDVKDLDDLPLIIVGRRLDLLFDVVGKRGEEVVSCDALDLADGVDVNLLFCSLFARGRGGGLVGLGVLVSADEADALGIAGIHVEYDLEEGVGHLDVVGANVSFGALFEEDRACHNINLTVPTSPSAT